MLIKPKVLTFLCVLLCLASVSIAATQPNLVVQTSGGQIQGYHADGVDQWVGVPYAKPPVGDLRFATPRPVSSWSGIRMATENRDVCPQGTPLVGSEDCLYANIYSPSKRVFGQTLPVLVWIYGGGWTAGDSHQNGMFNGSSLAKQNPDKVVVTFNYRLGAPGFLALPSLMGEGSGEWKKTVGNYGIHDQVALLKWVKQNIRAFGGDPSEVTLDGESAGAFSICIHIASPMSKNLFRSAIMQSTTCQGKVFYNSLESSYSWSRAYAKAVGCDSAIHTTGSQMMTCLRSKDISTLMSPDYASHFPEYVPTMWPVMPWGATIDGTFLPDLPIKVIKSGKANKVKSVIMGTNLDEGTLFVSAILIYVIPGLQPVLSAGDLGRIVGHYFGQNDTINGMVEEAYPLSDYFEHETLRAYAVLRDFFFLCPTSRAALALDKQGSSVYLYQFTHPSPLDPLATYGGVYHTAELGYVFNTTTTFEFTAENRKMVNTIGTYWSNLVEYSSPNRLPVSLPFTFSTETFWPKYDSKKLKSMKLDVPSVVVSELREEQCKMWDQISQ